jgi:phosphonate transport system ATP-binding protein
MCNPVLNVWGDGAALHSPQSFRSVKGHDVVSLIIKDLVKNFGAKRALDGVSLSVAPGEFICIIGRSGAGKSTLLRAINRLTPVDAGTITCGKTNVRRLRGAALRAWRAKAAMIFQQFNLVPRLDVITNVLLGRLAHRGVWASMFKSFTPAERAMAVQALERLGMLEAAFQRAETLSGGQQQRVAIARALLQEPGLILADEPVASLDPTNSTAVMDTLKAISQADGIPVLCNLHDLDIAMAYATRIVAMRAGKIVFDGPPSRLSEATIKLVYEAPAQA